MWCLWPSVVVHRVHRLLLKLLYHFKLLRWSNNWKVDVSRTNMLRMTIGKLANRLRVHLYRWLVNICVYSPAEHHRNTGYCDSGTPRSECRCHVTSVCDVICSQGARTCWRRRKTSRIHRWWGCDSGVSPMCTHRLYLPHSTPAAHLRSHRSANLECAFTARRHASAVYAVVMRPSVCPSVRLSVTSRHCTKMTKRRITQITPYDSPGALLFRCQRYRRISDGITSINEGAK